MATDPTVLDNPGRVNNPFFPYAWIWIASGTTQSSTGNPTTSWTEITMNENRPQRLLQLEYHRVATSGGNKLSATVYDETWTLIQSLIVTSQQNQIRWQYGYGEPGGKVSPIYEGVIIDFRRTLRIDGVEIAIEAVSKGVLQPKSGDLSTKMAYVDSAGNALSISDIVIAIANKNGWTPIVDTTAPYYGDSDTQGAMKVPFRFIQNGAKDLDFISNVLCPRAARLWDGAKDYKFFFEDKVSANGSFTPVLHFHPYHLDGEVTNVYTFMRDKESEVISFTPEIFGAALLGLGAGSVTSFYIDHQTGEVGSVKVDNSTTTSKQLLGGKLIDAVPHDPTTENANLHANFRPIRDAAQAQQEAETAYTRITNALYGGQLVIIGDSQIEPDTIILLYVILPDGTLDYTWGYYFINGVTDAVTAGSFTTSMDLIRNTYPSSQKTPLGQFTQIATGAQAQTGTPQGPT